MRLDREQCRALVCHDPPYVPVAGPLQLGMGRDAWRVAVCSMLLCRTRRVQAEPVLMSVLRRWPTAGHLARAEGLEDVLRPCGLHRNRSRQMQRFCVMWLGDGWSDMRELPGVGVYVADAVGLFCFGCMELRCVDRVLTAFRDSLSTIDSIEL